MKTIVVTGANSGIGFEICKLLLQKQHRVIMVARDSKKTTEAFESLKKIFPESELFIEKCDLSDLNNIKKLADQLNTYQNIDVLINNAGIELSQRQENQQGFELTWAINYLAPVFLTHLLIPKLIKSQNSRVIFTSSLVEKWGKLDFDDLQMKNHYNPEKSYYRTKLALLMFAYELSRRYSVDKLGVYTFEPGLTKTNFSRDFKGIMKFGSQVMKLFMKDPSIPAQTAVFLALSDEVTGITGKNYYMQKEKVTSNQSFDLEITKKLIAETEKELSIQLFNTIG